MGSMVSSLQGKDPKLWEAWYLPYKVRTINLGKYGILITRGEGCPSHEARLEGRGGGMTRKTRDGCQSNPAWCRAYG